MKEKGKLFHKPGLPTPEDCYAEDTAFIARAIAVVEKGFRGAQPVAGGGGQPARFRLAAPSAAE